MDKKNQEEQMKKQQSKLNKAALFFLEVIKIVVLAGITIFVIRTFLFKPFSVEGKSMFPTYENGEYLIIDELSYRFSDPDRGDVIVFVSPINPDEFYLKRVIGLPGEVVRVTDGKVFVSSADSPEWTELHESYLVNVKTTGSTRVTLEPGEFFVLGDNRNASLDSRRFGAIKREAIVGKTWFRGLPLHRISFFDTPEYGL
ncbi:MAG: signal peptidase I [Candidatus Magasanikbacteria bacterium]|nr:signal peptidase I [Candidatus Magasanikbacteria bacterium]